MLTKFETKSARVKGKDWPAAASMFANFSMLTDGFPSKKYRLMDCFCIVLSYCTFVSYHFYDARYVLVVN